MLLNRFTDGAQTRLVAIVGLQEAAILIEDVFAGVAGEFFKGRVGIDQDVVIAFLFGNHDAVVGGVDHQLQQFGVDHEAFSQSMSAAF